MQTLEDKILDNPDDWDAWLVYGDWLMQQGDLRGQLIGLEHQLATQPMPAAQRGPLIEQREQEQKRYEEQWLAGKTDTSGLRLHWRAGFIVGAEMWTWWGEQKKLAVVESIPTDPAGRLFCKLRIHSHCGPSGLKALSDSPVLSSVRQLVLSSIGMDSGTHNGIPGRHGLDIVVASPHVRKLERLDVSKNNFAVDSRPGYSSTSPGQELPLDLTFSEDKGEVLARLERLVELNLRGCCVGDDAVASLVGPAGLSRLEQLDLGGNRLTSAGAATLARSDRLGGLRALVLRDNALDFDGIEALASSEGLGALEQLDLSFALGDLSAGTGDRVAAIFAASRGLPQLRALNLRGLGLSEEGLARLTAARRCQILR